MRKEDLMIGDWVRLKDDYLSYEESCMKISFLSNSAICALKYKGTNTPIGLENSDENWMCPVFADEIEPIPLTPEILQKNDFILDNSMSPGQYYNGIDNRVILINDKESMNSTNEWYVHIDSEDYCSIASCELTYVHELQHIFRLCKIDKEIMV